MPKNIGVADVKRHFSEVISEVSLKGEHFIVEKKGKPMAALVNIKELKIIENSPTGAKKKGLLAAIGVWEDFDGLEKVVKDIYRKRVKAKDRNIDRLL